MFGPDGKSGTPKWILVATGLVGLTAGIFIAIAKYYEIHKARAEAEAAQAAARSRADAVPVAGPSVPAKQPQATPGNGSPPATKRDDAGLLQGQWKTTLRVFPGGKEVPKDDPRQHQTLDVRGNSFSLQVHSPGQAPAAGTFTLDRSPKHIDFVGRGPAGADIEMHGIYELTQDTFRMSVVWVGRGQPYDRPTEFTGPSGGDYFVFRRTGE